VFLEKREKLTIHQEQRTDRPHIWTEPRSRIFY